MNKQKTFLISEEELRQLYKEMVRTGFETESEDEFIKSKKPVELVSTVEPSKSARHLLLKAFNEGGTSTIKDLYVFQEGKYKVWIERQE